MTIRVIKVEPSPTVLKEVICHHCGVTLEYVPADVQRRDGHDYTGSADGCEYIECPNCKYHIILRSW